MIAIGSDHAGYRLKEQLKLLLRETGDDVTDLGCPDEQPFDYPDVAREVAAGVASGRYERGILICGSGIGMSIAANRFPGVRAALCVDEQMARMSRQHNDSNVLVLGARNTSAERAREILRAWMSAAFEGGRHLRRVSKIDGGGIMTPDNRIKRNLAAVDPEIFDSIRKETNRIESQLELIASENFVSEAVLEAMGSIFTNKYAEGYPGKRYYGGCEYVDVAESLARNRARQLFSAEHANVQPHSGSQANIATYMTLMRPGDTLMGMNLSHGGHLTHGHPLNFSGQMYKVIFYGVNRETERLDYDELDRLADENKPKVIMVGASAYPRVIDFERFRKTCDRVGARMVVDMAHIAGLVATGLHPSPVPVADFVTSTTHKTLRGPRGGLILCKESFAKELDKQVFPGHQGGPLMHIIAAKAVCFKEAMEPEFVEYQKQVVANASKLSKVIGERGFRIVSGGTDNHLFLVDVFSKGLTGKVAEEALDRAGITVNKNTIPFDQNKPFVASGLRMGTPALTTRGMKEPEMEIIGTLIADVLDKADDEAVQKSVREKIRELTSRFPLYAHRLQA